MTAAVTLASMGNGPAFNAYPSAGTVLNGTSSTKILFQNEEFDTNSCFASSRFTPTVAGYYQVNSCCTWIPAGTSSNWISIYKNGAEYQRGNRTLTSLLSSWSINSIVYMNGTTDYIEIWGFTNAGSVTTSSAGSDVYFNAAMIRGA